MRRVNPRLILWLAAALLWPLQRLPAASADDCDPARLADFQKAAQLLEEAEKTASVPAAKQASSLFERCERQCPDQSWFPMYHSIARVFAQDYYGAEAAIGRIRTILVRKAKELNRSEAGIDGDTKILFARSSINLYLGHQPGVAASNLERIRAKDPGFLRQPVSVMMFRARLQYAKDLADKQAWPEAITQTLLAKNETIGDPDSSRRDAALRNLGQLYRFSDRWKESQEIWEELLSRDPNNVAVRYGLAGTYADQFRYDAAIEQWKAVLKLIDAGKADPADAAQIEDARMRFGNCLVLGGHVDAAMKEFLAYLEKHKDDARIHYNIARVQWDQLNNPAEARKYAERSRELDPWCETTLRLLRTIYTAGFATDEEAQKKAKEIEDLLSNEGWNVERKKEMERRKSTRADRRDGCW